MKKDYRKISKCIPDLKLIEENTPIRINRATNFHYCRLLIREMNNFVNDCKNIINPYTP